MEAYLANNITTATGYHNRFAPISKRGQSPPERLFEKKCISYSCNQFTNLPDGVTICFGQRDAYTWWDGGRYVDEVVDILIVLQDQVAKEGWLKSSHSRDWAAVFQLGTTAFRNRDIHFFDLGLSMAERGTMLYY